MEHPVNEQRGQVVAADFDQARLCARRSLPWGREQHLSCPRYARGGADAERVDSCSLGDSAIKRSCASLPQRDAGFAGSLHLRILHSPEVARWCGHMAWPLMLDTFYS